MGGDYRSLAMWGALHFNRKREGVFFKPVWKLTGLGLSG